MKAKITDVKILKKSQGGSFPTPPDGGKGPENVEMWDDDFEKIPKYEDWGKEQCLSGRLKDFKINFIPKKNMT
jgi:hypothetical protein